MLLSFQTGSKFQHIAQNNTQLAPIILKLPHLCLRRRPRDHKRSLSFDSKYSPTCTDPRKYWSLTCHTSYAKLCYNYQTYEARYIHSLFTNQII